VSSTARWVICAVCAVLGVIAIIIAVIYLAVPIHSLPGFVPGKKVGYNGHYHKRALLAAIIGIVLLAIAVFVGWPARRQNATATGPTTGPAADPASGPATADDAGGSPTT
jgi:uncharacterized membrane protein